jgi:predicted O-methyltransferase YrrM
VTDYPNWFVQTAQHNFEKHLKEYIGLRDLKFLQIGAFTGDASVWMLSNILTDPSSLLVDVDTWQGSNEEVHAEMDFEDVYNTYKSKVIMYDYNVSSIRSKSNDFFLTEKPDTYDFIYIDGDHTASGVIDDAVQGWKLLKPNGIMAFDDYTWQHPDGLLVMPHGAINFFLWCKQKELTVLEINDQVWIRKNA